MFCSKCGSNVPDGALFCAVCGTPTNTENNNELQAQEQYTQPDYTAQQQQYTQPDYTAQQQYAQPDYTAQQQYAQPDYTAHQQYAQPGYTAQQQYQQQFSTMPAAPKKKSKKGLIIGLSCGGAAVITGGILTMTLAQSSIMRSVMGDTEYAKSVSTRFLAGEYSQYSDLAKSAVHTSSNAVSSLKNIAASTSSLSGYRDSASGYLMEDANLDTLRENYDRSTIQAASTLYMITGVMDAISKDGITASVGLKAELGESLTELIPDDYKVIVDDIRDVITTSELKICMEKQDGALGCSMYLTRNGGNFLGAVIRLTKDGDITIALPEATKRAIAFKIPSAAELGMPDTFEKKSEPLISSDDINKLTEEIAKAYLSCYENADIRYADGEVMIDENSTKCTVITVTFGAEEISTIIGKVADVIANDESAKKIAGELGSQEYLDRLIEQMHGAEENMKNYSGEAKLVVESYVNSANQPLGIKFTLGDGRQEYAFTSVDNGSYARTAVESNGSTLVELVDRKSSSSSGSAVLSVYPYAGYSSDSSQSIAIQIDYKDRGTFKSFGQETLGGTYTFSIVDSDMMQQAFSSFTGSGLNIYDIVKGLSVTVSSKEYNGGIEESFGAAVEKYGSVTITGRSVPGADIPALPGDLVMISQDSENANSEMNALAQDVMNYIKEKFTSDGQLKKLDEDFEKISGQKFSTAFDSALTGYTTRSRVTSADSTAASIKNSIDTFLTNADTMGCGMRWGLEYSSRVTGTVDGSGRWDITISDTSAFKSNSNYTWENTGSAYPNESKSGETNAARLMAIELANLFPDIRNACFEVQLIGGRCTALWYTPDTASPSLVSDFANGAMFDTDNGYGWSCGYSYSWDGVNAGITRDGYVVGTAPSLSLDR